MKSGRTLWFVSRTLLWIFIGAALATVIAAGRFWWQQPVNGPVLKGKTPEALSEKLDLYDKRAEELDKLLALLLGLSTIYAIALSLSAYQQLKDSADKLEDLRKEAQDKINQLPGEIANIKATARDDLNDFALRMQSKYPLFADMDIAIRGIMDRLMHLLPVLDWSDEDYRCLPPQVKQEILFYEKTVAAFEYYDLERIPKVRLTASEIYHGLGNFYGLRFVLESHLEEDKERSRFYLDRAIFYNPENVGALNDRGFLAMNLDKPPDFAKARKTFTESLAADPGQQRARYNLAYVEHVEKGNYARSKQLLSEALEKKAWQNGSPARHRASILYNRACAYARLGESDVSQKQNYFDKALADLKEMCDVGIADRAELPKSFKDDLQPGGDLSPLTSGNPWMKQVEEIAARLP